MPKQPRFDRRSGTPGKKPLRHRQGRAGPDASAGPSRMGERNRSRSRLVILIVEALLKFLPSPGQPRAVRYGIAVILVAVFFVFSLAAGIAVGPFEFLFLILPVLLASVLYDRGSGFLASGLSILAMASQLDWRADPVGNLAALVIFAIVASFVAVFCEALRKALERGAAAQEELKLLLAEQRHRMKNDLALLSSMITLQARSQASPPVRTALESAAARLHVFAEGQDQLQFATGDQTVHMQEYLEDVCQRLGEALRGVRPIAVWVDCENVTIDSKQAIRIGLMVNELATNALKHAFPNDHGGTIQVRLQRRPTDLIIMVEDDGVGCPEQLQIGLGSRLITLLAEQSGGSIKRETANPGCRAVITIPHGLSENGNAP
jgi:two-component sensor histidine kinase